MQQSNGITFTATAGPFVCSWCEIDQLHAALKTAQELAATRLQEIERLRAWAKELEESGIASAPNISNEAEPTPKQTD
jgi:hypothetical protein